MISSCISCPYGLKSQFLSELRLIKPYHHFVIEANRRDCSRVTFVLHFLAGCLVLDYVKFLIFDGFVSQKLLDHRAIRAGRGSVDSDLACHLPFSVLTSSSASCFSSTTKHSCQDGVWRPHLNGFLRASFVSTLYIIGPTPVALRYTAKHIEWQPSSIIQEEPVIRQAIVRRVAAKYHSTLARLNPTSPPLHLSRCPCLEIFWQR
jgi:hypothetical protein